MNRNIFLLLLFASLLGFSQPCEYETYNQKIKSAREAFASKNHKQACEAYLEAFGKVNISIGNDLYNAILSAEESGNKKLLEQWCIKAAKTGMPFRFFKKFSKEKWFAGFEKSFPEYSEHYQKNFNPELREKMVALQKYDKEVNERFHEWRTRKVEHNVDSLTVEMKKVSQRMTEIISQYGFPSESKTGYYFAKGKIDDSPFFVLLTHIYQRGELLYKDQLETMMCEGALSMYASKQLEITRGLGDSNGIEQEMEARVRKFRKNKKQL